MRVSLGQTQQIVATMPLLPPSSCQSNQRYIAPGGAMPNGLITPTGACVDSPAPITSGVSSGLPQGTSELILAGALSLGILFLAPGAWKIVAVGPIIWALPKGNISL